MRGWAPLLVAAITVPIAAAFALGGPPAGLAAGALAAATILLIAARRHPAGPIEVARAPGDRRRVLLLLADAIEDPAGAQRVATATRSGAEALAREPELLVLAPAVNRPLAHWLSDVGEARLDAQRRLVLSLGSLAAAEIDARGEVGDPDPLQAVEDALRRFAADEVLVAADADAGEALLAELRARLVIPVRAV